MPTDELELKEALLEKAEAGGAQTAGGDLILIDYTWSTDLPPCILDHDALATSS